MASFRTFSEQSRGNPCSGCPPPCCRIQLPAYPTPSQALGIPKAGGRQP